MNNKAHKRFLSAALFLLLTLGLYCALINPHFWRMGSDLYGIKSDNFATVWHLWALSQGYSKAGSTNLVSIPFGKSLRVNPLGFLTVLPTSWLASVTNEVFAFNFALFLSFSLSGLFTYVLVYLLTERAIPSILCGLAYMILPYHLAMSQYHFTLARIEIFPLFLLALVWFLKRPRWYRAGWILLAQFLSFSINPHYGLFNFIVLICFLLSYLFYGEREGWGRPSFTRIGSVLTLALLGAALGLPRYLVLSQENAEFAFGKPFEQLYSYSARLWDYFIPPLQHPLLGKLTGGFITSHIHNSYWHEQTLYLGWTLIVLAAIGAWHLRRSCVPEHRFFSVFLPLMALGSFILSLPPTVDILGLQIPMPAYFLHYLFPAFRVYARFGVVVATAVVILAGFGIVWTLERVRKKRTLALLISGLILFEFLNVPPWHYVDLSEVPPVYQWLADQAEVQAIAEFPLGFPPKKEGEHLNLWDVYEYMLWQRVHKKPLFNGEPGQLLNLAMKLQLSNPADPNTPVRLSWLGITHIVVHKDIVAPDILQGVRRNPDLEEVYSDERAVVFRIIGNIAQFSPGGFRYLPGVKVEEADHGGVVLSLGEGDCGPQQRLAVYGPYLALYRGRYRVRFQLSALESDTAEVRLAVVAGGGRRVLAEKEVDLSHRVNPTLEFWTEGETDVEFRVYGNSGALVFWGVELVQLAWGS